MSEPLSRRQRLASARRLYWYPWETWTDGAKHRVKPPDVDELICDIETFMPKLSHAGGTQWAFEYTVVDSKDYGSKPDVIIRFWDTELPNTILQRDPWAHLNRYKRHSVLKPKQTPKLPKMRKPKPVNCCCNWGAAVKGEYPEFGCVQCPIHQGSFGETELCRQHRKARLN